MFLAGTNFVLSYFMFKGRFRKIFLDNEFRFYSFFILITGVLSALVIYFKANVPVSDFHPMVLGQIVYNTLFQNHRVYP